MTIENGKTYEIKSGMFIGSSYIVEGLCTDIIGRSWSEHQDNPACLDYIARVVNEGLPVDDNVYYGKIGMFRKLMHVSQIGNEVQLEDDFKKEK